jgi:hypothetical protein
MFQQPVLVVAVMASICPPMAGAKLVVGGQRVIGLNIGSNRLGNTGWFTMVGATMKLT